MSQTEHHVIIGTAGHVDHGKTALIGALTGIETDRLTEEKRRGISIDLGFAPFRLPGGMIAGVVDVPGHEKFISNMLTGIGGIGLVLLVVDVNDGVVPQTREHLQSLGLLQIPQGIIVLTK
ncbi:MAG TPA: selenocysteine-specific translation elongation factor, partial [Geoalkalibacter subterraneus]|nr:selenocysteine-specific translation elongation factor [Geoalkalibacter subterraneus]